MPVTIIIVFHNEYIGVILRSLYSIVTHTPKALIHEIIYVDDASTSNYLSEEFTFYIEKTRAAIKNIRVIRLAKRLGANRAIFEGIKSVSNTEHLVIFTQVLDVNRNWLPPLLNPLLKNPQTVSVPVHEFKHWKHNETVVFDKRGVFDLRMQYTELPRLKMTAEIVNFRSPLIPPRGLFVISKKFLTKINENSDTLGGQDGNFIDLSLKIWTCGGRIIKVPCSRASHNFLESGFHDAFIRDRKKLHEEFETIINTWFDEYKEIYQNILSSQNKNNTFKKSAKPKNCKTFKWFLAKVAPDLKTNFLTQPKVVRTGKIQINNSHVACLHVRQNAIGEFLSLDNCKHAINFDMTRISDVRPRNGGKGGGGGGRNFLCWEAYNEVNYRNVSARFVALQPCHTIRQNQKFVYVEMDQHIHHIETNTCLEAVEKLNMALLTECELDKDSQIWKMHEFIE